MKRLLIVAALAIVTAGASGCWHWFRRSACNTCPPAGGAYGDPYMAPPSVLPGSDGYLPAPG